MNPLTGDQEILESIGLRHPPRTQAHVLVDQSSARPDLGRNLLKKRSLAMRRHVVQDIDEKYDVELSGWHGGIDIQPLKRKLSIRCEAGHLPCHPIREIDALPRDVESNTLELNAQASC